jgi:hypothetical protein
VGDPCIQYGGPTEKLNNSLFPPLPLKGKTTWQVGFLRRTPICTKVKSLSFYLASLFPYLPTTGYFTPKEDQTTTMAQPFARERSLDLSEDLVRESFTDPLLMDL